MKSREEKRRNKLNFCWGNPEFTPTMGDCRPIDKKLKKKEEEEEGFSFARD